MAAVTTDPGTTGELLYHRVIEGERWDSLAWAYYADAGRYEPILRANPELRDARGQWPAVPPAGALLLIPVLYREEIPRAEGLPPWVR